MTKFDKTFKSLLSIQLTSVLFTHLNRKGGVSHLFNSNQSLFWYSHTGFNHLEKAIEQLPVWALLPQLEKYSRTKPSIPHDLPEPSDHQVSFDIIVNSLFAEKKQKVYLKSPLLYIESCTQIPLKLSGIGTLKQSENSLNTLIKNDELFPTFFQAKSSISTRLKSLHRQIKKCSKTCNMLEIVELCNRYQSVLSLLSQELKKYDFYPQKHNLDDSKKLYSLFNQLTEAGQPLINLRVVISLATLLLLSYLEKQLTGTVSIEKKIKKKQNDILAEITGPHYFLDSLHFELQKCIDDVGKRIDTSHINYSLQQDYISFLNEKKSKLLAAYKDSVLLFFQKLYSNSFPFIAKTTLKYTVDLLLSSINWELFSENLAQLHLKNMNQISNKIENTPLLSVHFNTADKELFAKDIAQLLNEQRFILDIYYYFLSENRFLWVAECLKFSLCNNHATESNSIKTRFLQAFFLNLQANHAEHLFEELLSTARGDEREAFAILLLQSLNLLKKEEHLEIQFPKETDENTAQKWWNSSYYINSWNSQFRKLMLGLNNLWWFQVFDAISSYQIQEHHLFHSFLDFYKANYKEKQLLDDYITYLSHKIINDHLTSYRHILQLKNIASLFIARGIQHSELLSFTIQTQSFQSKIEDFWKKLVNAEYNSEQVDTNRHWATYQLQLLAHYLSVISHSESFLLLSSALNETTVNQLSDIFITAFDYHSPISITFIHSLQFLLFADQNLHHQFIKQTAIAIQKRPNVKAIIKLIESEYNGSSGLVYKFYAGLLYELKEELHYLDTYENAPDTRVLLEYDCISPEALLSDFILSLFLQVGAEKFSTQLSSLDKIDLQANAQKFLFKHADSLALGLNGHSHHLFTVLIKTFRETKKLSLKLLTEILAFQNNSHCWIQLQYVINLAFTPIKSLDSIPPIALFTAFINRGVIFSPSNLSPFKSLLRSYLNDSIYSSDLWEIASHIIDQATQVIKSPFQHHSLDLILIILNHFSELDFVITQHKSNYKLEEDVFKQCLNYVIKLLETSETEPIQKSKKELFPLLKTLVEQGKINPFGKYLSELSHTLEASDKPHKTILSFIQKQAELMLQFKNIVSKVPRPKLASKSDKACVQAILEEKKSILVLTRRENPRLFIQIISYFSFLKASLSDKTDTQLFKLLSQSLFFILPDDLKDTSVNDLSFLNDYARLFDHDISPIVLTKSLLQVQNYTQQRGLVYLCLADFDLFKHFICHQEKILPASIDHALYDEKINLLKAIYKDTCIKLSKTKNSRYNLIASQLYVILQELEFQQNYQGERLILLAETVYEHVSHYQAFSDALTELHYLLNKTITIEAPDTQSVGQTEEPHIQLSFLLKNIQNRLSHYKSDSNLHAILDTVLTQLSKSVLFILFFYPYTTTFSSKTISDIFNIIYTRSKTGDHSYKVVLEGKYQRLAQYNQFLSIMAKLSQKEMNLYLPFFAKGTQLLDAVSEAHLLPFLIHATRLNIHPKQIMMCSNSYETITYLISELNKSCPVLAEKYKDCLPKTMQARVNVSQVISDYKKAINTYRVSTHKQSLKKCKQLLTELIMSHPDQAKNSFKNIFFYNQELFPQLIESLAEPVQSQFFEMCLNKKHPYFFSDYLFSYVLSQNKDFQNLLSKLSFREFLSLNGIDINDVPVAFLAVKLLDNEPIKLNDISLQTFSQLLNYLYSFQLLKPMLTILENQHHLLAKLIYKAYFNAQSEFFILDTTELINILSHLPHHCLSACFKDLKETYQVSESQLFQTFISNHSILHVNQSSFTYLSQFFSLFGDQLELNNTNKLSSTIRYMYALYKLGKSFALNVNQIISYLSILNFLPGTIHQTHVETLAAAFGKLEYSAVLQNFMSNHRFAAKSLLLKEEIIKQIKKEYRAGKFEPESSLYQALLSLFESFFSTEAYSFLSHFLTFKRKASKTKFFETVDQLLAQNPMPSPEDIYKQLTETIDQLSEKIDLNDNDIIRIQLGQLFQSAQSQLVPHFFTAIQPSRDNISNLSVAQLLQIESDMEELISNSATRSLFLSYLQSQFISCWTDEFQLFYSGWETGTSLFDTLQIQLINTQEKIAFQDILTVLKDSFIKGVFKEGYSFEKYMDIFLFLFSRSSIQKNEFLEHFSNKLVLDINKEQLNALPILLESDCLTTANKLQLFKIILTQSPTDISLDLLKRLRKSQFFIQLWHHYLSCKNSHELLAETFVSGSLFDTFIIDQLKYYLNNNLLTVVDFLQTTSCEMQYYFSHCLYNAYDELSPEITIEGISFEHPGSQPLRSCLKASIEQRNTCFTTIFCQFLSRHLAYHKKPLPWLFQLLIDTGRIHIKKSLPTADSIYLSEIKSENKTLHPVAVFKYLKDANYVDYQGGITHHIRSTKHIKIPKLAQQISQSQYQHFVQSYSRYMLEKLDKQSFLINHLLKFCPKLFFETKINTTKKTKASYFNMINSKLVPYLISNSPSSGNERLIDDIILSIHHLENRHHLLSDGLKTLSLNEMFLLLFSDKRLFNCRLILLSYLFKSPSNEAKNEYVNWRQDLARVFVEEIAKLIAKPALSLEKKALFLDVVHTLLAVSADLFIPLMATHKVLLERSIGFQIDRIEGGIEALKTFLKNQPIQSLVSKEKMHPFLLSLHQNGLSVLDIFTVAASFIPKQSSILFNFKQFVTDLLKETFQPIGLASPNLHCLALLTPGLAIGYLDMAFFKGQFHGTTLKEILIKEKIIDQYGVLLETDRLKIYKQLFKTDYDYYFLKLYKYRYPAPFKENEYFDHKAKFVELVVNTIQAEQVFKQISVSEYQLILSRLLPSFSLYHKQMENTVLSEIKTAIETYQIKRLLNPQLQPFISTLFFQSARLFNKEKDTYYLDLYSKQINIQFTTQDLEPLIKQSNHENLIKHLQKQLVLDSNLFMINPNIYEERPILPDLSEQLSARIYEHLFKILESKRLVIKTILTFHHRLFSIFQATDNAWKQHVLLLFESLNETEWLLLRSILKQQPKGSAVNLEQALILKLNKKSVYKLHNLSQESVKKLCKVLNEEKKAERLQKEQTLADLNQTNQELDAKQLSESIDALSKLI